MQINSQDFFVTAEVDKFCSFFECMLYNWDEDFFKVTFVSQLIYASWKTTGFLTSRGKNP